MLRAGIDMIEAIDRGVAVPAGTPNEAVKRLEGAFLDICRNPEIQSEMKKQGFIPIAMGHEESRTYLEKMTAIYRELAAGLKK